MEDKFEKFRQAKAFTKDFVTYLKEDNELMFKITDYKKGYCAETSLTEEEIDELIRYLIKFLMVWYEKEEVKTGLIKWLKKL